MGDYVGMKIYAEGLEQLLDVAKRKIDVLQADKDNLNVHLDRMAPENARYRSALDNALAALCGIDKGVKPYGGFPEEICANPGSEAIQRNIKARGIIAAAINV